VTTKFATLGKALDKDNWEWLQRDNEEIAAAVAAEVAAGAEPEAIGRYVARTNGESRSAYTARVVSAARYLESTKA
jgi:hypothetical protein